MSANAAAQQAGFRTKLATVDRVIRLLPALTREELRQVIEHAEAILAA
jgi:hypothetical protein